MFAQDPKRAASGTGEREGIYTSNTSFPPHCCSPNLAKRDPHLRFQPVFLFPVNQLLSAERFLQPKGFHTHWSFNIASKSLCLAQPLRRARSRDASILCLANTSLYLARQADMEELFQSLNHCSQFSLHHSSFNRWLGSSSPGPGQLRPAGLQP